MNRKRSAGSVLCSDASGRLGFGPPVLYGVFWECERVWEITGCLLMLCGFLLRGSGAWGWVVLDGLTV